MSKKNKEKTHRLGLRIDESTRTLIRECALLKGKSVSRLVEEVLLEYCLREVIGGMVEE